MIALCAFIFLAAVMLTIAAILTAPEGAEIPGVGFVYTKRRAVRKVRAVGALRVEG